MAFYSLTLAQTDKITETLRSRRAVVGYLFGSYARGTAGPLSDIDIGVLFPKSMSEMDKENTIEDIRGDLERMFGRDKVDVVNVALVKKPLLRYAISLAEGKVLFSDDDSLKNDMANYARKDFEDTKPLRAIQAEALKSMFK